jgi:hypothetical protein
MAKKFGIRLDLEQFSNVQLEDARNKLRTEISQFEMNESFDSVYENSQYQKKRMFLDVINQEMLEREEQGIVIDFSTGPETRNVFRSQAMESVSEQWVESAKRRLSQGEYSYDDLVNELLVRYDLDETTATRVVRNVSILMNESEEDKAAIIMGSKDMVDRITGWLEDTAAMKAETLLELLDSIRDQLGSDKSEQFSQAVKPALENLYSTLESTRTTLAQGVGILTGESAGPTMGADTGMGMGGAAPDEEAFPSGDDFGASEPAAGGDEAAGRVKRESVEYSRKLGMMLAQSKKK